MKEVLWQTTFYLLSNTHKNQNQTLYTMNSSMYFYKNFMVLIEAYIQNLIMKRR